MTAALHLHMDSTHGHGPSPSASAAPPPWLRDHHLLGDFMASAPFPAPATPAPPNHHHHLRPAAPSARRISKRRPRPSRKLPTTYITADPASFRRMVHQVTGADDLPTPPPGHTHTPEALICRPAPSRAAGPPGALMLPTLDTSAFLLGAPTAPARTDAAGLSAAAPATDQAEAGGAGLGPAAAGVACSYASNSGSSSCGGFPTLDSWDALFSSN